MRTIKPEFFKHVGLHDLEQSSGLPVHRGLAGLWVCSDRDGLFEWEPRRLKTEIFPYHDLDFGKVLDALLEGGFIQKYEVDGKLYGCIPTWHKHQYPNGREPASGLPTPPNLTREARVDDEWEFLPVPSRLARLFYESLPQETRAAATPNWESLWSKDLEKIKDEFRIVDAVIQFAQESKWQKYIVRASTFVEKYPAIKSDWVNSLTVPDWEW
jgi:hypothetical protein